MTFLEPSFIDTNGIKMAVYEQGCGLPVVFSHGFPELAYSFRHQISALADAGFRAIAPDQRGYGNTKGPEDILAYDIKHLCDDMAGLLDALKLDKAVFCGHDWGGSVVWHMAQLHPDRVSGVIGVNTPLTPRVPMDPLELLKMTMGDRMYIVQFQEPGRAEAILEKDVEQTFKFFFQKSTLSSEKFEPNMQSLDFLEQLKLWDEQGKVDYGEMICSDEELDYYIQTFMKTGFTGGLNWYRNLSRNWEMTKDIEEKVNVPSLMISASDDAVLRPSMTEGMENLVPDVEKHVIDDCGHWTQHEKPEELNRLMIDWLKRRF